MSVTSYGSDAGINPLKHRENDNMPNIEMVETERGLRGKGNEGKKVKFMAISETAARPDNPLDAALQSVNGDLQEFWDRYVAGYNEFAYSAVADPIAAFIDPSWDSDKQKQFRNAVNAIAKITQRDKEDVAADFLKQMNG